MQAFAGPGNIVLSAESARPGNAGLTVLAGTAWTGGGASLEAMQLPADPCKTVLSVARQCRS
jgi:hypothetical protein